MISTIECELRLAAHAERVARVDRAGWQRTTAVAARPHPRRARALIARAGWLGRPIRLVGRGAALGGGRRFS